jgi:hypothetical protein
MNVTLLLALNDAFGALEKLAGQLRAAAKKGGTRDLIEFLRSEAKISLDDRNRLADLVAGNFGRQKGRPQKDRGEMYIRARIIIEVYELAKRLKREGNSKPYQQNAIQRISKAHGGRVSTEQIATWIKRLNKGERADLKRGIIGPTHNLFLALL